MSETFQEKFCRHFEVPVEEYGRIVLRSTLYPHARWLCLVGSHAFLDADRAFIAAVGNLTRRGDFIEEAQHFRRNRQNRNFWRHTLRLRVSTARMRALFSKVWVEQMEAAERAQGQTVLVEIKNGQNSATTP